MFVYKRTEDKRTVSEVGGASYNRGCAGGLYPC